MALRDSEIDTYRDIRDWLGAEFKYEVQLGKYGAPHEVPQPGRARDRVHDILQTELPDNWQRFHGLRESAGVRRLKAPELLKLDIGQQVLRCCALAQQAYVFDMATKGVPPIKSVSGSFERLDMFIDTIRSRPQAAPSRLQLVEPSVSKAVDMYYGYKGAYERPTNTLRTITGLAILALYEQVGEDSPPLLPKPGQRTGDLSQWEQPRLRVKPE